MARLSKEDEYFLAREAEQRAKWRADLENRAKAASEHLKIAQQVGVEDEQLAARIRALGFEGETARVLHLMPLVEVAWADGSLSAAERKVILRAADAHGIEPGSQAAIMLASMLEKRPADAVLEQILEALRDVLHAKSLQAGTVLEACLDVAEASGGFLGFGSKISDQERDLIDKIAASFGEAAKEQITRRLG
jgi:tellurite resistance protein